VSNIRHKNIDLVHQVRIPVLCASG